MMNINNNPTSIAREKRVDARSPIFWRITAGVFVSIMLIEAALLVFSWNTEKARLLSRLDDSLGTVASLLNNDNPLPQLDRLIENQSIQSKHQLIGYVYESELGERHVGGQSAGLTEQLGEHKVNLYSSDHSTYSVYKKRNLSSSGADKLWLRSETNWISNYMTNYILRILAMILLISVFVTVACLFFLTPLLISPLQRLNRLLVHGEKYGISTVNAKPKDLGRRDELGSVFRSFSHWRNELVASEKEKDFISQRFEEFANLGADCFWEIDDKLAFTYVAGDTMRLLSLSPEHIVGKSSDELVSELSSRLPDGDALVEAIQAGGVWEGDILPISADQEHHTVRIAATTLRDSNAKFSGIRGTIVDISHETELASKLRHQATHDDLTGLCNRRELADRLDESIALYESDGTVFALLALDLDHFKIINDRCGHIAGDQLLKGLASKMLSAVGEHDIVARTGGDEFAILLQATNLAAANAVAEKLRLSVEQYQFNWDGNYYSVSMSIGIAEVSPEISTVEALIFATDSCCIQAKNSGKNQVCVYSEGENSAGSLRDEVLWISRIHHALDNDCFELFQQTIARIDGAPDEHFEILLRLRNDDDGYWPPNLFLPVAERNGLMPKIDKWVVSNALDWLENASLPSDMEFCMNINLSAASLADSGFQQYLLSRVEQNTSLNQYVCFEMTETAAMANPEETISLLENLRSQGCRIALDDFGTGFSSLSHIRTLPIDYIKIDGAFVQEIYSNELDQVLVKSVADIAKCLDIKTVAEFVDTDEALQMLGTLGIDYAQGYLIAKPEALATLREAPLTHKVA